MKKQIDFYFDVVSPYSYVASTLIEDVAQRCNADLLWNPILLGGIFKAVGTSNAPGLTPAKKPYLLKDLQRLSRHYGIPLQICIAALCDVLNERGSNIGIWADHIEIKINLFFHYFLPLKLFL